MAREGHRFRIPGKSKGKTLKTAQMFVYCSKGLLRSFPRQLDKWLFGEIRCLLWPLNFAPAPVVKR